MYAIYGNLFEKINAYHSGVALYNLNGGPNISLDYFAGPTLVNALIPENITKDSQGNYDLTWDTYGLVEVTNYINETYWSKRELVMYGFTGLQVKQFLSWVPVYNQTHPIYNLFSIASDGTSSKVNNFFKTILNNNLVSSSSSSSSSDIDGSNENQIIYQNSSTCDDFVWASFNAIYQLGGTLVGMQSNPPKDQITLLTTGEPTIVDYNNATQRDQLASFYIHLMDLANHKNESALQIFEELIGLFNGTFYCYINEVYYEMYLSKSTPISFTYQPTPMPSGQRDSNSIKTLDNCYSKSSNPEKSFLDRFSKVQLIFIFIAIGLGTVIILYLSIGLIVNKARGKSGTNLIPNKKLWISIVSKFTDRNKYKPLLFENTIQ
ncbi:hypothetical protein RB653_003606 [Dictyostelium firmibasis]|uniref:Uncharacterized protein n=1 Tax=Dictyostelium firmibasis TaxID=79012 RepID=A0AAN7TXZ7_9MYCE